MKGEIQFLRDQCSNQLLSSGRAADYWSAESLLGRRNALFQFLNGQLDRFSILAGSTFDLRLLRCGQVDFNASLLIHLILRVVGKPRKFNRHLVNLP